MISLRRITLADTENIVRWRNSTEVRRNFINQDMLTPESHEWWMKNRVDTHQVAQFIIHESETDQDIGSIFLRDIDPVHRKAEMGIFIGENDCRGKGYGSSAIAEIIKIGFSEYSLQKIYLRVFADNEPAIRSYKKAGFQIEGVFKNDVIVDGVKRDIVFMAIFNNTRSISNDSIYSQTNS